MGKCDAVDCLLCWNVNIWMITINCCVRTMVSDSMALCLALLHVYLFENEFHWIKNTHTHTDNMNQSKEENGRTKRRTKENI